MITDYDSWHPDHGEVDVSQIIATLMGNADHAKNMIARLPDLLGMTRDDCPHGCDKALEFAMITQAPARDPAMVAKLDAVAGRVLGNAG
jgi:5'-methylthioadenosine phosphorylase